MVLSLLYVSLCPFYYCNHLDGKRELIALLNLSSWCLVMVERLFLAVPRGSLQFVIVVFPDHTHLLFLVYWRTVFLFFQAFEACDRLKIYLLYYLPCFK